MGHLLFVDVEVVGVVRVVTVARVVILRVVLFSPEQQSCDWMKFEVDWPAPMFVE